MRLDGDCELLDAQHDRDQAQIIHWLGDQAQILYWLRKRPWKGTHNDSAVQEH